LDALKRSIASDKGVRPQAQAKKGKKRIEGQREMLLPISGSKSEAKKPAAARAGSKQRKAG
jgi:DNA end-binding protein Ku